MRFLFYCHDATGLAHVQHDMAVAAHLVEIAPAPSVLFAVGTDELSRVGVPAGVEVLKLPALPEIAGARTTRRLGVPRPALRALRAGMLRTVAVSYRPDVLVVDRDPLGPCRELLPALEALRAQDARAVFAFGHVAGDTNPSLREWPAAWHDALTRYYDRIVLCGPRRVMRALPRSARLAPTAERIRYCGDAGSAARAAQHVLELATERHLQATAAVNGATVDAA